MKRLVAGKWLAAHPWPVAGSVIVFLFGLMALAGPFCFPRGPVDGAKPFLAPSLEHLFGTNDVGCDLFSEWVLASRISLTIGLLSALVSLIVGGGVGILAGYAKGIWGEILSGVIDVFLLIPVLPLMVVIVAYVGPGWLSTTLIIGLLSWCSTARAVRSKVLQLREAPFVEALKTLGMSRRRIILFHMIPHVMDIVSAKFVSAVPSAMVAEASLAFIGFGDPAAVSWGGMIHFAFHRGGFLNNLWTWYLPPGLAIGFCSLGFMLIGLQLPPGRGRRVTGYLAEVLTKSHKGV